MVSKIGYAEESENRLFTYANRIYEDYSGEPVCSFVLGHESELGAEKVNLSQLLEKLHDYIKNEVV